MIAATTTPRGPTTTNVSTPDNNDAHNNARDDARKDHNLSRYPPKKQRKFPREAVIAFHGRRAVAMVMQSWEPTNPKTYNDLLRTSVQMYNTKLREFLTHSDKDVSRVPTNYMYASLSVKQCFENDPVINMALISEDPFVQVNALPALKTALATNHTPMFRAVLLKYIRILTTSRSNNSVRHTFKSKVIEEEAEKEEEDGLGIWSTVTYKRGGQKKKQESDTYIFPSASAKAAFLYHPALVALWIDVPQSPAWNIPTQAPQQDDHHNHYY